MAKISRVVEEGQRLPPSSGSGARSGGGLGDAVQRCASADPQPDPTRGTMQGQKGRVGASRANHLPCDQRSSGRPTMTQSDPWHPLSGRHSPLRDSASNGSCCEARLDARCSSPSVPRYSACGFAVLCQAQLRTFSADAKNVRGLRIRSNSRPAAGSRTARSRGAARSEALPPHPPSALPGTRPPAVH